MKEPREPPSEATERKVEKLVAEEFRLEKRLKELVQEKQEAYRSCNGRMHLFYDHARTCLCRKKRIPR